MACIRVVYNIHCKRRYLKSPLLVLATSLSYSLVLSLIPIFNDLSIQEMSFCIMSDTYAIAVMLCIHLERERRI